MEPTVGVGGVPHVLLCLGLGVTEAAQRVCRGAGDGFRGGGPRTARSTVRAGAGPGSLAPAGLLSAVSRTQP